MALIVPNQAERNALDRLVTAWNTVTIHLYSNNLTPSATTVIGDFTEAAYSGYISQTVTWTAAATDGSGVGYILSNTIAFPLAGSGTQTVYGWYITDSAGALIVCKRFDASVIVSTTVRPDSFSVKFTLREDS